MKKILIKLLPFFYIEMTLNERIKKWCKSNNKHESYGKNMTHKKLDNMDIDRFEFRYKSIHQI